MKSSSAPIEAAIDQYGKASVAGSAEAAEKKRQAIAARYPLAAWPTMSLDDYALGQGDDHESFCRWMEFKSDELGSMRGGTSKKLAIYRRKADGSWYFPERFAPTIEAAWERLRAEFVEAFELAEQGDQWQRIDELEMLANACPGLRLKALHLYFPDRVMPVYSWDHLKHFLAKLGVTADETKGLDRVRLNRLLLERLRAVPKLADWSTIELMRLLYAWSDPREARRVVKIAPGREGMYWPDCLEGGYICVGWDEVGDLTEFSSKEEFRERFAQYHPYNGHQPQISRKSNELWTLMELEPGDLVVANKGTGHVLGIGTVTEEGYRFRPDRPDHQHTLSVEWDTSVARDITPQKGWATVTVAKVSPALLEEILGGTDVPKVHDPLHDALAATLRRKGQAVLYGPPGTGKTWTARRFAVWWLLRESGDAKADSCLSDPKTFARHERALSTGRAMPRVWWIVANPSEWAWDTLFKEGRVEYRYGRLKRNYPQVQAGDLVVGYQSTPDKRIVALARISREFASIDDAPPTVALAPLTKLTNGLTYDELSADAVLAASEPMRFRNQGTLFALTEDEAARLMGQLVDRCPELADGKVLNAGADDATVGQLTRITFHPSYTYEDFIEGFRPRQVSGGGLSLVLEDGVFKRVCREAQANPDRPYLVLIDEVNRGNVAKILGELITLLENDKRGLAVTLPQSKEAFSVPPNVYLLGTMNTADRSIRLLDSALRRRFAFVELMPDEELLAGAVVGDLRLDVFLGELNRRIARREGREKQIGHSYLLDGGSPVADPEEFACRFREEILPLLQEYCYDDYATLAEFIGEKLVDAEAQTLVQETLASAESLVAKLAVEFPAPADDA